MNVVRFDDLNTAYGSGAYSLINVTKSENYLCITGLILLFEFVTFDLDLFLHAATLFFYTA